MIRFGVDLHPIVDARQLLAEAQLAERLGYDMVWVADSQLIWREAYALLGAIAATTQRVQLGTGVTNPVTRHIAVVASACATLQELSGGRMQLGIGVGDSALRTMRMQPASLGELEEAIGALRALCRGQAVGPMQLSAGGADVCPPIFVAAAGPKMLTLAGRIGDGVILSGRARNDEVLAAMLACVRDGLGGRETSFSVVMSAAGAVDADRHTAHLAVRPHVARGLLTARWNLSEETQRVSERVKARYDYAKHMDPTAPHAELIPDEVVPEFALAGTPADCLAQIHGLVRGGVDAIVIQPYAVAGKPRSATLEAFAEVVDAYKRFAVQPELQED
jgi:5,10-methylenetetrahydromethanopterin reductase